MEINLVRKAVKSIYNNPSNSTKFNIPTLIQNIVQNYQLPGRLNSLKIQAMVYTHTSICIHNKHNI